jgi:hypothetical protein
MLLMSGTPGQGQPPRSPAPPVDSVWYDPQHTVGEGGRHAAPVTPELLDHAATPSTIRTAAPAVSASYMAAG